MNEEIQTLLRDCPEKIGKEIAPVHFCAGDFILRQGDAPEYVYLLLKGRAKNYLETSNGLSYLPDTTSRSALIGEVETFSGDSVICSVQADTECDTVRVGREDFFCWLKESDAFMMFCFRQITGRIRVSNRMAATNIAYPLRYRVESILWSMAAQGQKYVSKSDVILGLGAKLRSINRIVRDLTGEGLIEYDKGIIKIHSMERLTEDMKRQENKVIAYRP